MDHFLHSSAARFLRVMYGGNSDRTPVVPKIWIDWAAQQQYFSPAEAISDPATAVLGLVRAAMDMEFDAVRLFLLPARQVAMRDSMLIQFSETGRPMGQVDLTGGWATRLDNPLDYCVDCPEMVMTPQSYTATRAPIQSISDVRRICVPSAQWYDDSGYGEIVEHAQLLADDRIALIGDCNCGTLSFCVAMRGIMDAMVDLVDDPAMTHALMEKGIEIAYERAKFFISHGVHVLRYNDSSANMELISPQMWREFIAPHLRDFCRAVHRLSSDARIYCHICGDVRPILIDLVNTGLDCIAPLDPLGGARVEDIRRQLPPGFLIMGGVDTLQLLNGPAQHIYNAAVDCIAQGGAGYILGSGCAVSPMTPADHLKTLVAASIDTASTNDKRIV